MRNCLCLLLLTRLQNCSVPTAAGRDSTDTAPHLPALGGTLETLGTLHTFIQPAVILCIARIGVRTQDISRNMDLRTNECYDFRLLIPSGRQDLSHCHHPFESHQDCWPQCLIHHAYMGHDFIRMQKSNCRYTVG